MINKDSQDKNLKIMKIFFDLVNLFFNIIYVVKKFRML